MKIEYAPTRKVEVLAQVAHEFMQEILDVEPGSYVILAIERRRHFQ
jgi:hypothetical protein